MRVLFAIQLTLGTANMGVSSKPALEIERVIIRGADSERVRSDTASVLERSDGLILVAYHSYAHGPEGGGDFGAAKVYLAESGDGGRHWTNERLVADHVAGDLNVMSPYLCQVDDEILIGYVRNHSQGDTSMYLQRSTDGGESWGDPAPIWEHAGEYRIQGGASSMVRLNSGRLVLPIQSCDEVWKSDENQSVGTYLSDDGGHTWKPSANKIGLPMRGAMEPSIAQRADGSLLMSLRTQLGAVFLSESQDEGESWSRARTSGLRSPESCTCLRRLPNSDSLVLFWNDSEYVHDHHHLGIRSPLSAAVSADGGRSWDKVGDIDAGDCMLTNLGCTFLASGTAVLTYLSTPDPEIENGVYRGIRSTEDERSALFQMELVAALIPQGWFMA
jgi:sialidase-1